MKVELKINGQIFKGEGFAVIPVLEELLKAAEMIEEEDSLEVLSPEQSYVANKAG